jgi:hypothetical protein
MSLCSKSCSPGNKLTTLEMSPLGIGKERYEGASRLSAVDEAPVGPFTRFGGASAPGENDAR